MRAFAELTNLEGVDMNPLSNLGLSEDGQWKLLGIFIHHPASTIATSLWRQITSLSGQRMKNVEQDDVIRTFYAHTPFWYSRNDSGG